jgi:hypothetical protein
VAVTNGYYEIVLDAHNQISLAPDKEYYLEIRVDGYPELGAQYVITPNAKLGVSGFSYFTINGHSSNFTLTGCPNLKFEAAGSYVVIGYNTVKWKLYRDGTKIDEKTQRFYGFGSGMTSITFTKPPRSGTYTIEKRMFGGNQSYPPITVTLTNPSPNQCPLGWYDGANCFFMSKPAGGFIYHNKFYAQEQPGTTCPKGWYDGANCYIMPKPWNGFIWHNNFYVKSTSGNSCPSTVYGYPTHFDGANCYILSAPWGTKAFEYANNFYTTPVPNCPIGSFDGANCYIASAPSGTTAFEWHGNFYTTPKWCQ